ncbi:hypothetical protein Tco_1015591 [Tanacetum coccineum]|uniref:Uncharacterized protein n=1 Tax=Tanacetum coccineum TaxID=301880 RepID=A0ABQ5FLC3_9ASTR
METVTWEQQLFLDEEALRETLEEEAMAEKELEERIKQEQSHDELFRLEFKAHDKGRQELQQLLIGQQVTSLSPQELINHLLTNQELSVLVPFLSCA